MRTLAIGIVALAASLALPASAAAHRLDEYLQAARIALTTRAVTLEIDLTPGASIASRVAALADTDGDARISVAEAESYGRAVLRDVVLELDGQSLPLTLTRVDASTVGEMADGVGTVRITASADIEPLAAGRHRVFFRNEHRAEESVYLANALAPTDDTFIVMGQIRDPRQRQIAVDYDVQSMWPAQLGWSVLGACILGCLAHGRRFCA